MSAYFYKKGRGLFPADEEGARGLLKMGDGECVLLTIVRPRSVPWMRKYHAMCQSIADNCDPPRDKDSIDQEIRIRAGHFDVILVDGLEVRVPKRIAFDKLSQDGWEEYWQKVEAVICEVWGHEYLEAVAA